ncbi:DH domain-containing protein [Mycena sanguinolenta]|uniref:DH domain-containing protein n=1 Tax=Mycena sanguinolenta TaxID=230812 RepID=A0A8H6YNB9_9AGAR|nr:DH domain-containing protein [Mycena sanguinolenta]
MPLARSNTSARSKSRSPLPQSPRPPTFLPPSHYAEAGGLSPRPLARNDSLTSSPDSHSQRHAKSESRRGSVFMPISSNSDSSFEFCQKSKPAENKRFSISSKSASKNTSKRESHMTNLPFVEAQLLPSLRDTIDRMTRPPSRPFVPPSPPEPDVDTSEPSPEYIPAAQVPDDPASCFTEAPSSTPKPLKSALRAPTPKLQLRSPRPPAPDAPSLSTGGYSNDPASSRGFTSATSTSSRLPSGSALVSSALKNNRSDTLTSIRTRPRSRTDPGAPLDLHTSGIATPILKSKSSGAKGSAVSNIPRPRANSGMRSVSSTPRPQPSDPAADDSSSDLEFRYELEGRNRRSLRVVNGVLSSESESEADTRAPVGLGLGLASPYTSQPFASKLRARFSRNPSDGQLAVDEAAERRRKELIGLVKGLDQLGSQLQGHRQPEANDGQSQNSDHDCGVAVSGSGRLDFGAATSHGEPPQFLVSSSSGKDGIAGAARYPPAPPRPAKDQDKKERKIPSRSPVIRQPPPPTLQVEEETDVMPSVLRRHSVYHSALPRPRKSAAFGPSPPESLYEEPDDQESHVQHSPATYLHAHDRLQPRYQRHSDDLANSDTAMLALHSRLAAAREREALGIPPSASDAGCVEGYPRHGERLSYMDSGSSLARVGMAQWEDGDGRGGGGGDLSFGAEKLFRTLSGRTVDDDVLKGLKREVVRPTSIAFSQSSSASSVYDDDDDNGGRSSEPVGKPWGSEAHAEEEEGTDEKEKKISGEEVTEDAWRSSVSPATYIAIADRCGALEIHRQEIIYDLCVTEESFVSRLTTTINLFILPLRMQDSKCYISGVPAEIARLFDWLEDILNLHTRLLSALRRVREAQHPVVERIAEAIRVSFVKRLEVYQPYLARLVAVAETIARLVAETTNDFGEFVRIQESAEECRGWSLESLLVDPVTRLGEKLHEYTPKAHGDYVPTLALVHSTEIVIKVMTEVKVREDEYDLVKGMSRRIKGLSSSVSLAKRGRRLLCQGQLLRVGADPCVAESTQLPTTKSPPVNNRRNSRPRAITPAQKLVEAVHEWDQRRERSGSNASTSTAATSYSRTVVYRIFGAS